MNNKMQLYALRFFVVCCSFVVVQKKDDYFLKYILIIFFLISVNVIARKLMLTAVLGDPVLHLRRNRFYFIFHNPVFTCT